MKVVEVVLVPMNINAHLDLLKFNLDFADRKKQYSFIVLVINLVGISQKLQWKITVKIDLIWKIESGQLNLAKSEQSFVRQCCA